jgi:hypothetical protein
VGTVSLHGPVADIEAGRDLAIRQAHSRQFGHDPLTLTK